VIKKIYSAFVAAAFVFGMQSSSHAQTCKAIDAITSGTLKLTNQSQVCETTASLVFTYTSKGGSRVFNYGKTTSYGSIGGDISGPVKNATKTISLTGLESGTTYYFKIDGIYGSLKYTMTGSFTTNSSTPPVIAPTFAQTSIAVPCTTSKTRTHIASATGTAPITYTLSNQPPWITINGSTITFAPVSGSTNATVTLTATNRVGSASQTLNVTVFTPPTETAPSFAQTSIAVPCTTSKTRTHIASATGTAPITYTLSNQPPWITINGSTITFAPVSGSTNATVTLTATNGAGSASQTLNVTVFTPPSETAPSFAQTSIAVPCTTSKTRTHIASATGTAPITYTLSNQPPWITINGSTITFAPVSGSTNATVTLTATNRVGSASQTLNVSVFNPSIESAPSFAEASKAIICTTSTTSTITAAATGTAPITYSLSDQPPWITIDGSTITFEPVSGSTNATVTLTATNSIGSASQTLNVTVFTPSTDTAPNFDSATVAVVCTTSTIRTITASATGTAPITYSLSDQPPWITIDGSTITFAPVSGSTNATITLTATNSAGNATQTLNVIVFTPPTEDAPSFASFAVTVACTTGKVTNYTASATGTAPITYSLFAQPSWVTIDGATITCAPISGSTNALVTLTATNSAGSAIQLLNITVLKQSTDTAPKFASATVAVTCTTSRVTRYTASATGTAPITYSISGQPSWVTLGNNGVITFNAPRSVQTVPAITVTAKNKAGTATQTLNVTIIEPPVFTKNDVVASFSTTKWAATDTFCLIAWIEDNAGSFIKTLAVWGSVAEDLADVEPWFTVASSPTDSLGNTVDAVTSPTLVGNKDLRVNWNGADAKKAAVPNGTYKLCISGGIDGGPFPVIKTPFTIDGTKKTVTGVATSEFKNIVILINNGSTNIISSAQQSNCANNFLFHIGNTPIFVPSSETDMTALIYSLNGSLVMKKIISLKNGPVNLSANNFIPGTYICKISAPSNSVSQRFVVQK
jgi:hypothetical protein